MFKSQWILFLSISFSITLFGCQSTNEDEDTLGWGTRTVLCTGGGIAGSYIAKELANAYFEKSGTKYTAKEMDTYTKAFQLGLFVAFCKLADYAGNTIYKKLSEAGEEERRKQVLEAANSAQPTTYSDPTNPQLTGTVKPSKKYQESAANRECVDMEDTLADETNSETIYIKYCRDLPSGTFKPVTV